MIRLRRGQSYVLRFDAEGCSHESITIAKTFNAWFIGNLLIGGLIGMVVDAATHNLWALSPNWIDLNLRPEPAAATTRDHS
ncbi:MAG: hypothetical protein ACREIU_10610 [Planctomycetota bacterium]